MWERIRQDGKEYLPALGIIVFYLAGSVWLFGAVCPFRILFGIPCPGCGLTRSFLLLFQGKLMESIWIQPMAILLLPEIALFVWERYWNNQTIRWSKYYLIAWIGVSVFLYIVRMWLYFPDTPPMLYEREHWIHSFDFLWEWMMKKL